MRPNDSNVPPLQIELTSTICSAVAIVITLHRLYIKRYTFWVDDFCALFSMLLLFAQAVLILQFHGHINTFTHSYLVLVASYATTWSARIAILFTIIRVRSGQQHVLIISVAVVMFTLIWGVLTAQLFWVCEPQRRSSPSGSTEQNGCVLDKQIAILHIIASVVADLTLLLNALRLFRVIQDNSLRRRLKAIFSTCMASSVVAIINGAFILRGASGRAVIASLIEACVSLLVCSLPMVVNAIFHITPAPVHSPKHSHIRSLSSPLSPISPTSTMHFAMVPNSNASSLFLTESERYKGYDSDLTPVTSTRLLSKASDLERCDISEITIAGRSPSLYATSMSFEGKTLGEELARPLPVAQRHSVDSLTDIVIKVPVP